MFKNRLFPVISTFVILLISCGNNTASKSGLSEDHLAVISKDKPPLKKDIVVGANRTEMYLPILQGQRVGIVANQTTVIFHDKIKENAHDNGSKDKAQEFTHLVDSLLALDIDIKAVFAPEHGFRGTADAGESIKDGVDVKTNLPIISLYGNNKKPKPEQLKNIDIMIFDIQDVGARFYTYISSLHYVMEACAEANIPLLILDRPNPNGHFVDGPILEKEHKSFVGMHPIPIVHGMTIAEYAQMINGEQWLLNGVSCKLSIIDMQHYNHNLSYSLPINPSPNLPNDQAINLYPSLCFFEGTTVSAGRGTPTQFQVYGSPYLNKNVYNFKFTPTPNLGAKHPKYNGELCFGENLTQTDRLESLRLSYLIKAYNNSVDQASFFNDFFTKLAGTKKLRQQIEQGLSEKDIKASWQAGLTDFKQKRAAYLLYD